VRGLHDNSSTRAAWIYSRSGGVWTQQGNKLVGTGAVGIAYEGSSVALSGGGNTAFVGGPYDNSSTGQRGSTPAAAVSGPNKAASWSVPARLDKRDKASPLRSPPNAVIVGRFGDNSYTGAAWVFGRNGTVWTQQGNKLVGTGAVERATQGVSVALSAARRRTPTTSW
jgi:hypothetical protein